MGQKELADGVLEIILQKAINEEGWQPEFMRELDDIQPPPMKLFTERWLIDKFGREKAPPGLVVEPGAAGQ